LTDEGVLRREEGVGSLYECGRRFDWTWHSHAQMMIL